jgi:hypothetical protein
MGKNRGVVPSSSTGVVPDTGTQTISRLSIQVKPSVFGTEGTICVNQV